MPSIVFNDENQNAVNYHSKDTNNYSLHENQEHLFIDVVNTFPSLNQTDSQSSDDMQLISKAKFKELMDQSIELIKSKELISKLKLQLIEKTAFINSLRSKVHRIQLNTKQQTTCSGIKLDERNETPNQKNIKVRKI